MYGYIGNLVGILFYLAICVLFVDFAYEVNGFYAKRYERNPGSFWVTVVLGIVGVLIIGTILWSFYCFTEFNCEGNILLSAVSLGIGSILLILANSRIFEEGCNI